MTTTTISWTDRTWNVGRGCRRKSTGCEHCYAERQANRFKGPGQAYEGLIKLVGGKPRWSGAVKFVAETLADPLHWKKPCRVFVDSMSDLFYEKFSNEQIAAVFGVMAACPQHSFQILTKRPDRMRAWFEWLDEEIETDAAEWSGRDCAVSIHDARDVCRVLFVMERAIEMLPDHHKGYVVTARDAIGDSAVWPLPNVWLGTSVENQDTANERIPELLQTPAAIRFLSCEPLLGPIDFAAASPNARSTVEDLDWVIAGCESGPGARACDIAWLRSLRDQCVAADVAFFLKQAVKLRGTDDASGDAHRIERGRGSREKGHGFGGNVIELPYLDGEQWAQFPEQKAAA